MVNRILVTGGAGFIGSNLCEALLKQGHFVRCLDNFATGKITNLLSLIEQYPSSFQLIVGDIRKLEDCQKAVEGMEYVLHEAALGSVPRSINDPITTWDSDDKYLLAKIEKQVFLLESLPNESGDVYCWMTYCNNINKKFICLHNLQLKECVPYEFVEKPTISGTLTYMFRWHVFEKLGGWHDNIGIICDCELAARACQKCKIDFGLESLINTYVNHGSQRMSDRKYYKALYEKITIFVDMWEFLFDYQLFNINSRDKW